MCIRDSQHVVRLSASEQDVIHWLALERTALSLDYLADHLLPHQPINDVWTTLSSLLRRHLVEKDAAGFFLQDIVLEYVTDRLVRTLGDEIVKGQVDYFRRLPLLNPTAREYKRLGQERFMAAPLADRLRHAWPQRGMAQRLVDLVTMERGTGLPGYTAGNSLNLLRHIGDDLTGADFSQVSIWRLPAGRGSARGQPGGRRPARDRVYGGLFQRGCSRAQSRRRVVGGWRGQR